jgi:hypothetical protein
MAYSMAVCLTALVASGCESAPEWSPPEGCVTDVEFFEREVQARVITPICADCHTAEGAARESDLRFVGSAQPDWLAVNQERLADLAGLERAGTSLVLLKPSGGEDHGGGKVIEEDSVEWAILEEFVRRLSDPVADCGDREGPGDDLEGLVLEPEAHTLRRAALSLGGRLPTAAEIDAVEHGGEAALAAALDGLLEEPAFLNRAKEVWNDALLTDRYLTWTAALQLLDYDRYPNRYWFEAWDGDEEGLGRSRTNEAVAREPLEIIARVLREDRPFTEILTADWTVVNGYSAVAYGLQSEQPDPSDPHEQDFYEARLETPHAGVLTTAALLGRYPSTATNRNRHRARIVLERFLATDILATADRPIDPTATTVHNPTLNDPVCSVCHDVIDPIAGTFQNRNDGGHYVPPDAGWFPEMYPPGFGETSLPIQDQPAALPWLGAQLAEDARFPVAVARIFFTGLTGESVRTAAEAGDDPVAVVAWERQDALIRDMAEAMVVSDWNAKAAVRSLFLAPWMRVADEEGADDAALELAGTARLLTPEELDRKLQAVAGLRWVAWRTGPLYLADRYRLLYGGIDSRGVVERLREPNGVIAGVGLRMAHNVACRVTALDFVLDAPNRRLFPTVEPGWRPFTDAGHEVPTVEEAARATLQWLHAQLLGETLAADDPEIDAAYTLWLEALADGAAALASGELSATLPGTCRGEIDPLTGEPLPEELRLVYDPDFTIRAWMAVVTALLADYRFVHE